MRPTTGRAPTSGAGSRRGRARARSGALGGGVVAHARTRAQTHAHRHTHTQAHTHTHTHTHKHARTHAHTHTHTNTHTHTHTRRTHTHAHERTRTPARASDMLGAGARAPRARPRICSPRTAECAPPNSHQPHVRAPGGFEASRCRASRGANRVRKSLPRTQSAASEIRTAPDFFFSVGGRPQLRARRTSRIRFRTRTAWHEHITHDLVFAANSHSARIPCKKASRSPKTYRGLTFEHPFMT